MKVVVFCAKSFYCVYLLNYLTQHGIKINAIVIDEHSEKSTFYRRLVGRVKNRLPLFILNAWRQLRGQSKMPPHFSNRFYQKYNSEVIPVRSINSEYCIKAMKRSRPDLVVLGTARILHKPIIGVPKYGILNAHPGLLPKYRGVEMIRWAIYNGDPVGVTLHYVERGVDTGPIIYQEKIDLKKGDTISSIKMRSIALSSKLMLKAIEEIMKNGTVPCIPNDMERGKQYYRMSKEQMHEVNGILGTMFPK